MIELGHFLPGGALLGRDDKGINETYRGTIEIGNARLVAHVKLLPDRQLVNELLASVLGRLVGLPIPRGFLVLVQRADYPSSPFLTSQSVDQAAAFAVETIAAQSVARRLDLVSIPAKAQMLRDWPHWYSAAAFDDWIANADRHTGNLLVGAKGEAWLIDHSHAFMGDKWTVAHLVPTALTGNHLCAAMATFLNPAEKRAALQACLTAIQRFASVNTVKAAELAHILEELEPKDFDALTGFVSQRVLSVVNRISLTLGIPSLSL